MIVGLGEHPKFLLDKLRDFIDLPNVLIYPEFYDDMQSLIRRKWSKYINDLVRMRDIVIIALWPDYYYRLNSVLADLPIIYIFPLHSLHELEFVLKLSDKVDMFIGYASNPKYRNYSLREFLNLSKTYGLSTWYLGANSRELKQALQYGFDGVDITPIAFPRLGFKDFRKPGFVEKYAEFIKYLALNDKANLIRFMR